MDIAVIILFVIIFGIGLFVFIKGFISLKWKRLIENIPTSKIRSIAMGLVEIYGKVVPREKGLFKSPFSYNDCVYYEYKIKELQRRGKHTRWVTIDKGKEYDMFYLEDETGKVLVDPNRAKVEIEKDNEYDSTIGRDPSYEVQRFLKNHALRFEGMLFGINKTMKYYEWFIAPGDDLYVLGTAMDNPFVRDGSVTEGVDDIIIRKGENDKYFYISDRNEKKILKKYMLKSYGGIIGGSLIIIFALIVISILR